MYYLKELWLMIYVYVMISFFEYKQMIDVSFIKMQFCFGSYMMNTFACSFSEDRYSEGCWRSLCSNGHCCSFSSRSQVDGPVDWHLFSVALQTRETTELISLHRCQTGSKDLHWPEEGAERTGKYLFYICWAHKLDFCLNAFLKKSTFNWL